MREAIVKKLIVRCSVDDETAEKLADAGLNTPAQIKALSQKELEKVVGKSKAAQIKQKFARPAVE